jgi:hypothetical protein
MAVSNLFDGVDWYSTSPQKHTYSVKIPISDNFPTPLSYIDGGSALLIGGTSGKAHIIDCKSLNVLQVLDHNGAVSSPVEIPGNVNPRDQRMDAFNQSYVLFTHAETVGL